MAVLKNRRVWPLVGAALFFALLWKLGFPQPNYDDLFYTGAALHLAAGGDFSNPYLARQMFPSHFFFVYPPLHSYVLAGWLKVFGIHAASQTGFMMLNMLVICAAMLGIMRRRQSPAWAEWLLPLAVTFAFLPAGLRPETLAVAMTLVGFDLAERGAPGGWLNFAGFLLMFLGASCAPRVTFFALALACCAIYEVWRKLDDKKQRLKLGASWLIAGSFAGLVFLVLIHFRLHEFLETFRFHAARVSGKPFAILADYATHVLGILQWPLVLLPLLMIADALRKKWERSANAGLFVLAAFVPVILTGGVGHGSIWWAMILMFLFAGVFVRNNPPVRAAIMQGLIIFALLLVNRKLFANVYGLVSGNISADAGPQAELVRTMRPTAEHPLLLDGAVARHVFDFRPPEGCLDVEFGAAFPGGLPGDISGSEFRPGDIYAIGPATVGVLKARTYLEAETPMWSAFGVRVVSFDKYPNHVYLVRPEDCKDSRPRNYAPVYLPKESH